MIGQKFSLSFQKVNYKAFNAILFTFLFLISAVFYPKFGEIQPQAFSAYYIVIGILMVGTAVSWNVLFCQALQKEQVIEFELIQMLQPLLTIFLGSLIFVSERSMYILPAAVIASLALVASHIKRHHISFDKYARYLIWGVVFASVEMIFVKIMLEVYSPVALYMVRTFFIAIVMWIAFKPTFANVNWKKVVTIIVLAAIAVLQMVLMYSAVVEEGLIYTTLVLIISPILIYVASLIIYKEKFTLRTAIFYAIILACIVFASIMEKR